MSSHASICCTRSRTTFAYARLASSRGCCGPAAALCWSNSLQFGDRPAWDGLLAGFPKAFHEPFYANYAHADLVGLFAAAGFDHVASELAFLSKIMVFDRRSTSPPGSGEENVGSDERTRRSGFIFAKASLDDK